MTFRKKKDTRHFQKLMDCFKSFVPNLNNQREYRGTLNTVSLET